MSDILTCTNIHKSFQKRDEEKLEILKGISLSIEEKHINVIVGKSGVGKSTLLHILAGLDKPDSGSVNFGEFILDKMKDEDISKFRNKNLGFVFQFHHLLPEFTALENISIPQMIGGVEKVKADNRSRELLDIVGLSERWNHNPSELSGGEQQRIAIARALANNPKIIFADEPTGNLDLTTGEECIALLKQLSRERGVTVISATHDFKMLNVSDQVVWIRDGRVDKIENREELSISIGQIGSRE